MAAQVSTQTALGVCCATFLAQAGLTLAFKFVFFSYDGTV